MKNEIIIHRTNEIFVINAGEQSVAEEPGAGLAGPSEACLAFRYL
jgi:hypothetical protein